MTAQLFERDDDEESNGNDSTPKCAQSCTVLSVQSVEINEDTVRLVRLRDSLRARAYCDENYIQHKMVAFDKWDEQTASRFKYDTDAEMQVFYMAFDDYFSAFRSTIVCCQKLSVDKIPTAPSLTSHSF